MADLEQIYFNCKCIVNLEIGNGYVDMVENEVKFYGEGEKMSEFLNLGQFFVGGGESFRVYNFCFSGFFEI